VYLVGAGPGAPDLLTLRAARLLAGADVVFHDALVHPETLALAPRADKLAVGKRCGRHSVAQRFINKRLVDAALKHACVIRLKGGDPLLFGRAQEEIAALREAGIACEIVPGISAAFAASAELGIALSERGVSRSVTFVTPRVGDGESACDWAASVLAADTAALYMAGSRSEAVGRELLARGLAAATPVIVVRDASLPERQELPTRLGELGQLDLTGSAPTLILLGEVFEQRVRRAELAAAARGAPPRVGARARA
jgi:uroporphyrin-III C-methyltransferase